MSKLIDADKLRAQIKQWVPDGNDDHEVGERIGYNSVLHFIDEASDLSLTLESLVLLDAMLCCVRNNKTIFTFEQMPEEKYIEVLKRFNDRVKR